MMKAEMIFVGTELLLGEILNTNAQFLSERLALIGVDVFYHQTVGDNPERLAGCLRTALERSDVVITSGGLGPTMDDLTREIAAEVTGCPLELNEEILANLTAWFAGRGRTMTQNNARQAMVPRGATVLKNDRGTAPGLIIHVAGGKSIIMLPGPPIELRPMFETEVIPYLTACVGGSPLSLVTRILRFIDIGESSLEDQLKDLIAAQSDPSIAPYAKLAECHLRIATKAQDTESGLARIAPVEAEIRRRVGQYLYGVDGTSLEVAVGELLKERKLTVSVAESCTGGLIAKRLTDAPGSSAYFGMGFCTYSYESKTRFLGVPEALLNEHGAVSQEVVEAMAQGALERSGANVAMAVSGIAGPDGGTPDKPVGTVWFGLAARDQAAGDSLPGGVYSRRAQFWGSRADVRERSAVFVLAMLRRFLLGQNL